MMMVVEDEEDEIGTRKTFIFLFALLFFSFLLISSMGLGQTHLFLQYQNLDFSKQTLGASFNSFPRMNFILERYSNVAQGLQIHSDASTQERLSTECAADCTLEATCKTEALPDFKANAEIAVSHNVSNLKVSTRHDLALVFTCKVCETRSMKTCSRDSYEKGVVAVRCGGCNNLHLIADRLGWFGEPGSIEELLAARGDVVKKCPIDSLNLTLEDLAGKNL